MSKIPLKSIANIVNGSTPSSKNSKYYNGDIIWITPNDLSQQKCKYIYNGERNITEEGYNSCSTKLIPANNILLSSRAPIGLIAINKVQCCTNQGFKNIIIDSSKCDVEYLYYYIKYHIIEIEQLGSGTTFKEVSKSSMENYLIDLPSITIQNKIANVLKALDDKIENNNNIISELEQMAKTIYDYWFLQFEFPNEEGKPYKSSGGKMVWNDELKKEIPEGWENIPIKDIANLYQPATISSNEISKEGKYMVYGANGIIGKYNKYNHKENEIAVCCRGANCGKYLMTLPFSWITGNSMVITPKEQYDIKEYIYYKLSDGDIFNYITGSAQPQITRSNIENIKILLPTKAVVDKFNSIIKKVRRKLIDIQLENQELTQLRDFLLPLLMNGQVRF